MVFILTVSIVLMMMTAVFKAQAQTTCNITEPSLDDFMCSGNATVASATPLSGNNAALETLRGWCAADARCAELYGQDGAPSLALFAHLFQTTFPGSISNAYLETPLFDLLCNRTVEEFQMLGWQLLLKVQILDSTNVCDVTEQATLDSNTGTVVCSCQPGKVCDGTSGSLVVEILVVAAVLLAVVIQFGVVMWNRMRMTQFMENAPSFKPPSSATTNVSTAAASMAKSGSKGSGGIRYRKFG